MYDVIVIGTGPIGQTVADRKAMLRPVVAVADARRVAGARQEPAAPDGSLRRELVTRAFTDAGIDVRTGGTVTDRARPLSRHYSSTNGSRESP